MPSLTWTLPAGRPCVFPVFKRLTSIGSASTNDVRVESSAVADYHAQLVFDGKEFWLNEVDRKGELQINGKKKRRGKVMHGDRLLVGDADLVFSVFDESASIESNPVGQKTDRDNVAGLRSLFEFSQRLMEVPSVAELLDALIDAVIEVTHADKGFVLWLENSEPRIAVARNLKQQAIPDAVRHLSDSIVARVVETKRPLIVSDAVHDTDFRGSESVMNLKLSSVMCAPLIAHGNLVGLLYVGNDRVVSLFDEASLELLSIFAAQASIIVQNALLLDQLKSDRDALAGRLETKKFGDILATCPSMLDVIRKVDKVAGTDISVLVTGETGTGKELIARELHTRSPRAKGPFIVVNCGAIPETLMESELFGHVRGAFTGAIATRDGKFQAANGGTIFLDEIGEMPLPLQVKLLRALQERIVTKIGDTKQERVDIRVVAATNRTLEDEVRKGTFREDLYYRLNVVNLHLPPLRERGDDVVVLAKFFLDRYTVELGSKVKGFTPNAIVAIRKYEWPGNIRQLENRVKKALVLCDKSLVGAEDLDLFPEALAPIMPLAQAREEFQRRYILEILERNSGNRTRTAQDLGVDPRTIFRYLEREPDAPASDRSAGEEG